MDKLEPIIRNRFWILAGLVLPLAVWGYYSANSSLKAATSERVQKLDSIKNGVAAGASTPNKDYSEKLSHINTNYEQWVNEAIVDLWKRQQALMDWPSQIAPEIPVTYGNEIKPSVRVQYEREYPHIIRELEYSVQPVMPMLNQQGDQNRVGNVVRQDGSVDTSRVPWEQKVILFATTPQTYVTGGRIRSQEMWDAQADVWMVRLIYNAIRNTNEDRKSVTEAVVRRIDRFELVGGSGEPMLAGGENDMMGGLGMDMMGGMGGDMGDGSGVASNIAKPVVSSVPFDPAQEFGSSISADGMGGGDGMGGMDMMMMMGGGMGGASGAPPVRYIGDAESAPYWERGFYLSVIIMQNKIPDFLLELSNAPWPIRIERFSVGTNPYRENNQRMMTSTNSMMGGGLGGPQSLLGGGLTGGMSGMGGGMRRSGGMGGGLAGMSGASSLSSMMSGMGGLSGSSRSSLSSMAGRGGMGGNMGTNPLSQSLPPFAMGAMNHPDLVQLDLCGVITMYKQPEESLAAIGEPVPEIVEPDAEAERLEAETFKSEMPVLDPPIDPVPEGESGEMPIDYFGEGPEGNPSESPNPNTLNFDSPLPQTGE